MSHMSSQPTRTRTRESARQSAAIVFIAASLAFCASPAFAQDSQDGVISNAGGTLTRSADEGPVHAAVRRAGAQLTGSPALGPQASQPSSWVVRHPVITGTLIGAGAGAALSRTRAAGGGNHDPRVALIGAGAGAWSGLVAGAVHKARAKEKVGVATKIGIAAGAIGIVVLPLLACYGAGGCGGVS